VPNDQLLHVPMYVYMSARRNMKVCSLCVQISCYHICSLFNTCLFVMRSSR